MAKIHKILICTALIGAFVVVFCAVPVSAQTITNGDTLATNFEIRGGDSSSGEPSSIDFVVNGTDNGGTASLSLQDDNDTVRFNLNPSSTLAVGDIVDVVITLYVTTPAMYDTNYNTTGRFYVGGRSDAMDLLSVSGYRVNSTKDEVYQDAKITYWTSDWPGDYAWLTFDQPSFGYSYHEYVIIASYKVLSLPTTYGRYFYVRELDEFTSVPSETYNTDRVIQNQNENTDKILGEFFDPEYDTPDETTKDEYLDKESAALQDANDMMQGGNDVMNDAIGAFDKVGGLHEGLMAWSAIFAEFIGVPGMDGNNKNLYWLYWLVLLCLGLGLATFVIGSVNAVVGRVRSNNGKKRGKGG